MRIYFDYTRFPVTTIWYLWPRIRLQDGQIIHPFLGCGIRILGVGISLGRNKKTYTTGEVY